MKDQNELIPLRPGEVLHFEREKQSISVQQAAQYLKVKPAVVEAIERGETGQIAPVYLRGYYRSYARLLDLDPDDFEELLSKEQSPDPEVQSVFLPSRPAGGGDRWLKATSYLVASVLVAALVWQFTHEAVRFSQGENLPETASETGQEAPGGTEPAAVKRPANNHLNASIASMEVIRQRRQAAQPSVGEEAWAAVGAPGESVTAPVSLEGLVGLELNTSADSWVEITDAFGETIEMDLLRAGSNRQYNGMPPFTIMLGRASAVELFLDGEAVDLAPHTRGNVVRMSLGQAPETQE